MAANRAYVAYDSNSLGPGFDGTSYFPGFVVQYIVLNSDNVAIHGNTTLSLDVSFTYSNNNMNQLITTAVQDNEGDSSLQVYFIP